MVFPVPPLASSATPPVNPLPKELGNVTLIAIQFTLGLNASIIVAFIKPNIYSGEGWNGVMVQFLIIDPWYEVVSNLKWH